MAPASEADLVWGSLLVVGAAYEVWAVRRGKGQTLSATTKRLFHIKSTWGKAAFLVVWCGFATWFALHIAGQLP